MSEKKKPDTGFEQGQLELNMLSANEKNESFQNTGDTLELLKTIDNLRAALNSAERLLEKKREQDQKEWKREKRYRHALRYGIFGRKR
jgi:hypothetical protein